jgi:hypothetical protein
LEIVVKVLNRRNDVEGLYIGRPSKWGNPFVIGKDGTREEVVRKYRLYAVRKFTNSDLEELRGHDLVCWCAPLACHGDVLVELVEELV